MIRQKDGYIASRLLLTQGHRFDVAILLLRYILTFSSEKLKTHSYL